MGSEKDELKTSISTLKETLFCGGTAVFGTAIAVGLLKTKVRVSS